MPTAKAQDAGAEAPADFFPESSRVAFRRAQLAQVVCQLRFPTVLRIESSAPAEFQERVRDSLPYFQRQQQLAGQLPADLASMFGQVSGGQIAYEFRSETGATVLSLSPDALTLTTNSYTRWEEFRSLVEMGIDALVSIYRPSFFTRIGLRYINLIDKGDLGIEAERWPSLINSRVLGEMAEPIFSDYVSEARRILRLKDPHGSGGVLLQHGFNGSDTLKYLIDFDFYTGDKTNAADVQPLIDRFHTRAGHAFRWFLEPRLYHALGPVPCD